MFPSRAYLWILSGDIVCLGFSFLWVTVLRRMDDLSLPLLKQHAVLFGALTPLWLWVFHMCGFYEFRYFRRLPSAVLATGIFISFLLSALALYFVSGLYDIPTPKTILLLSSFLAWAMLFFWRDRMASWLGLRSQEDLVTNTMFGGEFLVVDRKALLSNSLNGYYEKLKNASLTGVPVLTNQSLEVFKTGRIPVDELEPVWVVENVLMPNFGHLFYRVSKRVLDIVCTILVLPFALLVGAVVAAWLSVTLGWPLFYKQKRIGKGNKEFVIWKFRTMKDAPAGASTTTQENDARIPSSARWVRGLHLDELPQILNILKGEMSWVGPRPEQIPVTQDLEAKIPYYWVRHIATPGLTGWAQVNMGYAGNFDSAKERFAFDLYYLANRSVVLDTAILLRTLRSVLTADGR